MFIWLLVIVVLAAFWVVIWAQQRMAGRNLWIVMAWSVAALIAWRIALEPLRLNSILSFMIFLCIVAAGYYQLQRRKPLPKRSAMPIKSKAKHKRQRKRH